MVKEEGEEGDDEGELGVKKEEDIMEADSKQDVKDNWSMRPPLTSNSSWIDEIEEEVSCYALKSHSFSILLFLGKVVVTLKYGSLFLLNCPKGG